jgi:hypothetical protein
MCLPCCWCTYRDGAERDLAAAERAVKQLELAAPKAAQLAAAKREEAADLEARLGQLQVCPRAGLRALLVSAIPNPFGGQIPNAWWCSVWHCGSWLVVCQTTRK